MELTLTRIRALEEDLHLVRRGPISSRNNERILGRYPTIVGTINCRRLTFSEAVLPPAFWLLE